MSVDVAGAAPVDDDDWEWTIALAKVRADEDMEAPAAAPPATLPRSMAARTRPMAAVAGSSRDTARALPRLPGPRTPDPARAVERPPAVTVIPVPVLPTVLGTNGASRLEPVLHTATAAPPAGVPRRFPDGTLSPEMGPYAAARLDDTDPNLSVGDRTTPGFAMPPAARPVTLRGRSRR